MNLREIREVKKRYPKHAVIASLMVASDEESWNEILPQVEDDRRRRPRAQLRLPARHVRARHGLGRRPGAGVHRDDHALGKEFAKMPVIVKLTPNITDILDAGARGEGAAAPTRSR